MTSQDTSLNTSFDSSSSLQRFNNPLSVGVLPGRLASSFAIASGGSFTDNASSNFAGVLSNPFDDARVYANGAVTLNGMPTFSGFGDGLTLGPTGTLQNVSAQLAGSLKLGRVAEAITIDVPAYLVPTLGAIDRSIESWRMPLNGAADVVAAFGSGEVKTVRFTGGSLNLPSETVLRNLTIVVENGDVNFNGDRHLLENVRLVVLNGSVNLGDVQGQNLEVYAARSIHMNQAARFGGKSFLGTQNGDVIFNGATNTIGSQDYVKVVAHGDVIFNAAANTRGDFWSTEDFFANRESSIVGKIRAQQSITFNAKVNVVGAALGTIELTVSQQPAIGIIDTGFARNNPDIDYSRIRNLKDWVGNDNDSFLNPGEGNEHGTHELGIIAAIQDNGIGIDGVNGNAPIYISRATGSGKWSRALVDFLKRFEADASQPNPIVYLGFDLTQMNADGKISTRTELTLEERSALEYARQKGALIIVPAGNDGGVMSALGQAAQEFDNLVVVGAVDANGRASYSSYGAGLTIMAPGGTIADPTLSTVGDGLGTMAGTSIAAAYAVGHISNVWSANPNLSYQQVIDIIKATALDINQPGWDAETSAGVLDVTAAVELAQRTQGTIYDPPATILTGAKAFAGLSLERPANYSTDFTGKIAPKEGANVRSSPAIRPDNIIGTRGKDELVRFTRWTYGESVPAWGLVNTPDERWYYDAEKGGWIASAIVFGDAPGSTRLRPRDSNTGDPNNQKPIVATNISSPSYQNGPDNPFAYEWKGQCTWYAYGRMVETGLLPRGAAANGLFLGNAEAWRRDAARAGLALNSSPTPGTRELVVFPPGVQGANSKYGHVAFVEEVLANGNIRISEYNWSSPETYGTRTLTPAQHAGLVFIPLENASTSPGLNSPSAKPGEQREYRVRPGDTLSAIALRELGNADRWREIKKADGSIFTDTEARRLQIGQSIYLPVIFEPGTSSSQNSKPDNNPIVLPRKGAPVQSSSIVVVVSKYTDERNYTGQVWTRIDVEPGNEGKKHRVIIEWGNYRWEEDVKPLNGGKSIVLNYQKREKDSIPRIIKIMPVPSPDIDYKDSAIISTATTISNGTGNPGEDGIDINNGWEEILSGYQLKDEAPGVALYQNGSNFLQSVDLSSGASLNFRYGESENLNVDNPDFKLQSINEAWKDFKKEKPTQAFSMINGQFFEYSWWQGGETTKLAYPTKINGEIIKKGGLDGLMLEVWNDHADIETFSVEKFNSTTSAPNIIGALREDNKEKKPLDSIGRTFIGIDDKDLNGSYETIYIFSAEKSTAATAARTLKQFGADKVIMLDGSGSSQLVVEDKTYLKGDQRKIPQTIGILKKSS